MLLLTLRIYGAPYVYSNVLRINIDGQVSLKDDGVTGQTTGQ